MGNQSVAASSGWLGKAASAWLLERFGQGWTSTVQNDLCWGTEWFGSKNDWHKADVCPDVLSPRMTRHEEFIIEIAFKISVGEFFRSA